MKEKRKMSKGKSENVEFSFTYSVQKNKGNMWGNCVYFGRRYCALISFSLQ